MKIAILTEDKDLVDKLSKNFRIISDIKYACDYDIVVLISYSKIIKQEDLSKKIYLNVHNSLLPKYRGLHAFTWAIINGERFVGYTLHRVESSLDSGPIISQVKFEVDETDNINDVFRKGKKILIEWISKELQTLTYEKIKNAQPQNENLATYVTKRKPEDNLIDWNQPAVNVFNFIRALTPPYTEGAFSYLNNQLVRIIEAERLNIPHYLERPGNIINKDQRGIWVKVKDSAILVKKILIDNKIYEGKNIMFKIGDRFQSIYKE